MTVVPSVCPLDCPDRCSLAVKVEGGRVLEIDGSELNPMTASYICGKVRKFPQRVHGPLRVRQPAVRVGPKGPGARFEPVSWDEALSLVADRFSTIAAESGWEAVLPYWYAGSNGWLTGGGLDLRLWNRLGTTRILRTLCAANTGAGVARSYGDLPSADPLDVDHTDLAVVWGCNPSASGIHLVPHLRAVQQRGGGLIVVDPRQTPLAVHADLHLAPLPGTDVALAHAIARWLFEQGRIDRAFTARWVADVDAYQALVEPWTPARAAEVTGVPAAAIVEAAQRYADADRAIVRVGWGLERTRNGTDAVRSVLALPALTGRFGRRGEGWILSTSAGYRVDAKRWQEVPGAPTGPRTVNMSELGRILEEVRDPPIRALYVYDCNPAVTVPDQVRVLRNLARDDLFTVVHEQVHTDTVDYADVVLPATTFLEHHEIVRSYGGYLVQYAEPAIPPVGESRSNHQVMASLACAFGLGDEAAFRVSERELAAEIAGHARVDFAALERDKVVRVAAPLQFVDVVPSRPITLVDAAGPRYRPPPVDAALPLIVISPSSTRAISSTGFETLPAGTAVVGVHPDDAAARGLTDGSPARVFNSVGEVHLRISIDPKLRPGVACIPKGLWRSGTLNGHTSNALIPGHVDELGGGACYNDARVEIEALATVRS
ncbi:MAG: molybdopterin-dependent oxidoreductase [Myxococcota bacterium]